MTMKDCFDEPFKNLYINTKTFIIVLNFFNIFILANHRPLRPMYVVNVVCLKKKKKGIGKPIKYQKNLVINDL